MNGGPQGYSMMAGPEGAEPACGLMHGLPLAQVLDELDYGVMLLCAEGSLVHANEAARVLMLQNEVFVLVGNRPVPVDANQRPRWRLLLSACSAGERRLDLFASARETLSVAVMPMVTANSHHASTTLLAMFGRQRTCEPRSIGAFARAFQLSAAETRVLTLLSLGRAPAEIADAHGVTISTVRTQIKQVLGKTGSENIRDLLARLSRLAPMRDRFGCGQGGAAS